MDFKSYYFGLTSQQRQALADACDTSVGHLRNVAYGKTCSEALAIAIERESHGAVRIETLSGAADWSYVFGQGAAIRSAESSQLNEAA